MMVADTNHNASTGIDDDDDDDEDEVQVQVQVVADTTLIKESTGELSPQDLLNRCKLMLIEISQGITTSAAAAAATTVRGGGGGFRGHGDNNKHNEQLLNTTTQLYSILNDEQKKNYADRLIAFNMKNRGNTEVVGTNNDYDDESYPEINHRKNKRIYYTDKDLVAIKEVQKISTSVVINHVLPYLDHDTWKSVTTLSKEIYYTVRRLKLYPPWPTHGIKLDFGYEEYRYNIDDDKPYFGLSFDHTDGSRFAVMHKLQESGSIYDSRRGLIKKIDFGMIIHQEEQQRGEFYERGVNEMDMYLLDRKTFIVKLSLSGYSHILYLYRIVEEDDSSNFKVVGLDMIRHSNVTNGPWFFNRNGTVYVVTVIQVRSNDNTEGKKLVLINQYLGETAWPDCLCETHRLQYPKKRMEIELFRFLSQPFENIQDNARDERIVLVSVTNRGDRHVHCWRIHFDHPGPAGINGGYHNSNIVPYLSCEKIPDLELRRDITSSLKIVPLPNEANDNYLFRIIKIYPSWWHQYVDGMEEYYCERESDVEEIDVDEYTFKELEKYNRNNILMWDYNIKTNKFENANRLLLSNWDGSPIPYHNLTVSEDGRHLFSQSLRIDADCFDHFETESNDFSVGRIDNLDGSIIENYKTISGENYTGDYTNIGLSNDQRIIAIPREGDFDDNKRPDIIHINYLYLNSPNILTNHTAMKQCMKNWLSR